MNTTASYNPNIYNNILNNMNSVAIITENDVEYKEKDKENLIKLLTMQWTKSITHIQTGPCKSNIENFIHKIFVTDDKEFVYQANCNYFYQNMVIFFEQYTYLGFFQAPRTNPLMVKNILNKMIHSNKTFIFIKTKKKSLGRNSTFVINKLEKLKDRDYFIIDYNGEIYNKGKKILSLN